MDGFSITFHPSRIAIDRWAQPRDLYKTVIICSIAAAVQLVLFPPFAPFTHVIAGRRRHTHAPLTLVFSFHVHGNVEDGIKQVPTAPTFRSRKTSTLIPIAVVPMLRRTNGSLVLSTLRKYSLGIVLFLARLIFRSATHFLCRSLSCSLLSPSLPPTPKKTPPTKPTDLFPTLPLMTLLTS